MEIRGAVALVTGAGPGIGGLPASGWRAKAARSPSTCAMSCFGTQHAIATTREPGGDVIVKISSMTGHRHQVN